MPDSTQNVLVPLPCPLCGAEPRMIIRDDDGRNFIECRQGEMTGSHKCTAAAPTYAGALSIWNTRATPAAQASTDYELWRKAWNDNRGPLPQVTKLTGERLDKLRRRIKEGLTLEDFTRAAWICSHTDFLLRGTPKVSFHASFDWLINTNGKVTEVLEKKYGETGKTAEELKAEAALQQKAETFKAHEMLAHLSIRQKQGREYAPAIQRNIERWEADAQACIQKLDAGATDVPSELARVIREWQKRIQEVTPETTETYSTGG